MPLWHLIVNGGSETEPSPGRPDWREVEEELLEDLKNILRKPQYQVFESMLHGAHVHRGAIHDASLDAERPEHPPEPEPTPQTQDAGSDEPASGGNTNEAGKTEASPTEHAEAWPQSHSMES